MKLKRLNTLEEGVENAAFEGINYTIDYLRNIQLNLVLLLPNSTEITKYLMLK